MIQVESHLLKMIFEVIGWTAPFAAVHHARKLVEGFLIKSKRFAYFPRCGTLSIGNDVRRHRRPELAVALIYILNRLLSLVSARQVEIDVRPFATFFREESFKEQFHANRIDRRNSQGIAHRAVRSRPAPLHEDLLLAAKPNDVPNDQEITGEVQFLNQREFPFDLSFGASEQIAVLLRAIAILKSFFR